MMTVQIGPLVEVHDGEKVYRSGDIVEVTDSLGQALLQGHSASAIQVEAPAPRARRKET